MTVQHVDVLVVGAGISGIGAAYHLQVECPEPHLRHPRGTRRHRRHLGSVPLSRASAPTATCTRSATASSRGPPTRRSPTARRSWRTCARRSPSTASTGTSASATMVRAGRVVERRRATWTVEADLADSGEPVDVHLQLPVHVLGLLQLQGGLHARVRRPRAVRAARSCTRRQWPEDLDYAGKRVVVIGSGATAMTLVPAMADDRRPRHHAAALADLRRVAARRRRDRQRACARCCPTRWPTRITRWKNIALQQFLYRRTRTHPDKVEGRLLDLVRKELGPDYDVDDALHADATTRGTSACAWCRTATCSRRSARARRRSSPTRSTRSPRPASSSQSGEQLDADIIVTATGLQPGHARRDGVRRSTASPSISRRPGPTRA